MYDQIERAKIYYRNRGDLAEIFDALEWEGRIAIALKTAELKDTLLSLHPRVLIRLEPLQNASTIFGLPTT